MTVFLLYPDLTLSLPLSPSLSLRERERKRERETREREKHERVYKNGIYRNCQLIRCNSTFFVLALKENSFENIGNFDCRAIVQYLQHKGHMTTPIPIIHEDLVSTFGDDASSFWIQTTGTGIMQN